MRRILLPLLVVAVLAAACGDDTVEAGIDPTTTVPGTAAPSTTVPPTTVPLITVPATTVPPTTVSSTPGPIEPPDGPVPVVVGGGTSFGECGGLCVAELRVDGTDISLERRSWDRSVQVHATGVLTDAGRERLDAVEAGLFGAELDGTYGCPDCADGGAAWIDVVPVVGASRSTYEAGRPPAVLAAWDEFLADASAALARCTSGDVLTVSADCVTEPGDSTAPGLRIAGGGFSFGMCFGYCFTQLEIDDTTVILTRRAWSDISDEDFPDQVVQGALTTQGQEFLGRLARDLALVALQETYGCPDCADGGSGWVDLEIRSGVRRSTFEYADAPEPLVGVDDAVRAMIETLRSCEPSELVIPGPDCVPAD